MPQLKGKINDFVAGDKLEIRRTIGDLIAPLDHVYFTIKARRSDSDAEAIVQKEITIVLDDDQGQIITAGDDTTPAEIVFVLLPADTADLWQKLFRYDIKAFDSNGNPYHSELGYIYARRPITSAIA